MTKNKPKTPIGASLVILSSAFYASYGIWTKLMGNYFGGYTASAIRSFLVIIILLPIALIYKKIGKFKLKKTWPYWIGMIGFSFFIWGPLYFAILHAGIGISISLNYASYIIGMFVLGGLFAKEKFTKGKIISAMLGLVGISLVFAHGISSFGWLALLAAALSGICAAGVTFFTKIIPYETTQTTLSLWVSSAIANTIMIFVVGEHVPSFTLSKEWLYLLIFALASIIASWCLIRGIKLIDAGAAGILGLSEIVFGVVFGVIFFNEHLGPIELIGIAVIISAAAIPYLQELVRR
jgi:S-adenosylmethionine uptake transporter